MGAAPLRFLLLLAVTFAEENAVFSDDDNFVSPTAAADATEAALKSSSGGASSAWSEALQAAVAREAKAWATAPADVAAATRDAAAAVAGGAHAVAAWPLRDPAAALPLGRALPLDALKKLQPTTDTVAVPLGETGVALVAVVAGRAMANATVTVERPASRRRLRRPFRGRRRGRALVVALAARGRPRGGETAGALTVRAGGRAVATARLTLEAPPPASPSRVASGAARASRGGADLFDDRGLRLELAPDCGAWKRTSDVLTRSLDDGAPVFVWRWTSACGESRVSFEARVAPRDARVVAAATVEAPAPWDDGSPPGMGAEGSVWDQFAWLGTVDLGAKLRLLSARDRSAGDDGDGPQLDWKLSPPYPAGWRHGGMGWTTDDGVVTLRASGGPAAKHKRRGVFGRKGAASATRLDFSFAVTPARALTPAAIFAPEMRRFHAKQWDPPDCAALAKRGVRGVSLHQGGLLNPRPRPARKKRPREPPKRPRYINYPFHDATMHRLRRYAQSCEAAGVAVSPYYTHRETSIHAAELALASALFRGTADAPLAAYESRSPDGRPRTDRTLDARLGAGDYVLAWRTPRGARHLALCGGMKGFYMDGISASPAAIGAARRGAERALSKVASKKNAPHRAPFLDLHAANKTAVYLELYPHMDAVWTGEASNYELGPDHFLVGVAGVPFGLPSQMLSGAVRKQPRLYYRALLFGMTERAGWFDSDTSLARLGALWAVVDAFELRDSELVGFWRRGDARFAATAPGDCGDRVKRTAFVVDGAAVVVLASWASTPRRPPTTTASPATLGKCVARRKERAAANGGMEVLLPPPRDLRDDRGRDGLPRVKEYEDALPDLSLGRPSRAKARSDYIFGAVYEHVDACGRPKLVASTSITPERQYLEDGRSSSQVSRLLTAGRGSSRVVWAGIGRRNAGVGEGEMAVIRQAVVDDRSSRLRVEKLAGIKPYSAHGW
ncbi:hypothetical protein JL720_12359 [Aureococcus anophagefferens]|nr:hypothetical protein JL720_12359 [Aureococcus anophagefferens]